MSTQRAGTVHVDWRGDGPGEIEAQEGLEYLAGILAARPAVALGPLIGTDLWMDPAAYAPGAMLRGAAILPYPGTPFSWARIVIAADAPLRCGVCHRSFAAGDGWLACGQVECGSCGAGATSSLADGS